MLGGAESRLPEQPVVNDLDPLPPVPETITMVHDPRLLIVNSEACVVVSALSSGGDTPEKLEPAVFAVVSGGGDHVPLDQATTGRWSALSTRQGLVAAKTFYCAVLNEATREALLDEDTAGSLMLRIFVEGRGVRGFRTTVSLDGDFLEELIDLARRLDSG